MQTELFNGLEWFWRHHALPAVGGVPSGLP